MEENKQQDEGKQVMAQFTTGLSEKYQVSDAVIEIHTGMNTAKLCEVINAMLRQEDKEEGDHKFLFIVENQLLQSTLQNLMVELNLTTEKVLNIVYTLAIDKPKLEKSTKENEWISCLSFLNIPKMSIVEREYAVGLYNGVLKVYSPENKEIASDLIHKDGVTDLSWAHLDSGNTFLFSSSDDQTVHVYNWAKSIPELLYIGTAKAAVRCLATSVVNEKLFASGSSDGSVQVWDAEPMAQIGPSKPSKRKKIEAADLPLKTELSGIHTMPVTGMQFSGLSELLTASQDHTIKQISLPKGEIISTLFTNYAGVNCIDSYQHSVFCGQTDCTIRQWDLRDSSLVRTYSEGHSSWVSSVSLNPLNKNILLTGGYDGLVSIWDIRGEKRPLQKVCIQKDKVMAVGWNGAKKIVSGGSEGKLYVHSLQF